MTDPAALLALASTGTMAIGVIAVATLKAWHEWLELRRMEIEKSKGRGSPGRTELTDLRARVKRLEMIANG